MSNIQREVILCHGKIDAVVLSQLEMMLFTSAGGVIHSVKIPLLDKAETLDYVMHQELIPHVSVHSTCFVLQVEQLTGIT